MAESPEPVTAANDQTTTAVMIESSWPRVQWLCEEATRLLGRDRVRVDDTTRALHSYDASLERERPEVVVAPRDRDEMRGLIAAAYRCEVPFVVRGAGTGYSGGALPAEGGMVILTADLNRILDSDFEEGWIHCEPGVILADVQQLAASSGWRYVPDPASYQVCTIGGNIAENAGGPHALGGGPTSNYVSAVELVGSDGSVTWFDEQQPWNGGLDLRSLVVGSEGTLGAVASVKLRLVRAPETEQVVLATFERQEDAVAAVRSVFDEGLLPPAMDMLTGGFIPGRPAYVDPSLLFISLHGGREEVTDQADRLSRAVRSHEGRCELLQLEHFLPRRAELVHGKVRRMVAASGCPRYYLFDAVTPRSRLADLMVVIRGAASEYGFPVLNTFHAGDGNVHPTPFFDPDDTDHRARLLRFSAEVLRQCHRMGGSLSGEHGIGLEKRELMAEVFPPESLAIMRAVKHAFDPTGSSNPGKVIPPPKQRSDQGPAHTTVPMPRRSTPTPPRVHWVDALIEVNDPGTTFDDLEVALAGSPYELPYEPLGSTAEGSVIGAVDAGLPALREAGPARARDLVVGASLWQATEARSVNLGGSCAKDVAGYELRKVVYGGRGRLGTLSGLRLRMMPRPTDSRLIYGSPMSVVGAVELCRRVYRAGPPFGYLGVLIAIDGSATVTGRIEVRGGSAATHVATLRELDRAVEWAIDIGKRWSDPVMTVLAGSADQLTSTPGVPWRLLDTLRQCAAERTAAFASIGHRCAWVRGGPKAEPPQLRLVSAVVDAFRAVP